MDDTTLVFIISIGALVALACLLIEDYLERERIG